MGPMPNGDVERLYDIGIRNVDVDLVNALLKATVEATYQGKADVSARWLGHTSRQLQVRVDSIIDCTNVYLICCSRE